MLPHRIAAGAIVFRDAKILLVRYPDAKGGSVLVAPGGRVEQDESASQAAVRETREETGISITSRKLLFIEELLGDSYRMCKMWFLCDFVTGDLRATDAAREEGITQAGWFSAAELSGQKVFPSILFDHDWASFAAADWQVRCAEIRTMDH